MNWLKTNIMLLACFALLTGAAAAQKTSRKRVVAPSTATTTTTNAKVSDSEIAGGLKEALSKGVKTAVDSLGKENGFLDNTRVRIPLPGSMQKLEKGLRLAGQGQRVDDFVGSMNHAAEKAVPVAIDVFIDAIKQMSFDDARQILFSSQEDAATQFFRRTTEENLRIKFRPIIEKFTAQVGVTNSYKAMVGKAGFASQIFGKDSTDLDGYVTQKALDGLFLLVADEEKGIRKDPIGRTTNLLKKVFGVLN